MNESRLSDRSCASISEQYEGALIRAAFRILEEEEMKQLSQPSPMDAEARRACRRGEPDFRRRLRGRYTAHVMRRFTHRSLPRLAQLTAALISLLALCAGVALAASGNVREWAAGLLIPPVVQPEDSPFTFGELDLRYTDGAVLDDVLYVTSGTGAQLYAYQSSSTEPTVLRCAGNSPVIDALTAYEGQLYALCTTYAEQAADSFGLPTDTGVQLSRVVPGADGTYTLEPVLMLSNDQLYDGGAPDAVSRQVTGMTIGGDELCLATSFSRKSDGQFFQPRRVRLISVHLQSGEITELIPTAVDDGFSLDVQPFYGDAGQTLAAVQDADSVRIVRILPDHSLSELTIIGRTGRMSAHFFGYDPEKDMLYYHQGSALYAMPHFDAAQTRRVALSASAEVRGLPIGGSSYALINLRGIRIFDLEQAPDVSGGTLTIDSGTASRALVDAFIAEHGVDVSVASIFSDEILPALREGDNSTDIFTFQSFDREAPDLLRDEAAAPIQSESLREALGRMLPGMRSVCLRGDAPIALPTAIFVYADVRFYAEPLAAYGYTQADLPSTWLEFLHFLRDHARREQVVPICNDLHNADDFRAALLDRLIAAWLRNPENAKAGFASQDMLLLLDAFREIDFSRFLYAPENPSAADCLLMLNADMNPVFDMGKELVLPVTDGGPAIARASCKLSTVNPNAQSAGLAARFLEFIHDSCAPDERALVAAQPDSAADPAALRCRGRYDDVSFDLTYAQLAEQHYDDFLAVLRPFLDGEADGLALAAQLDAFFAL